MQVGISGNDNTSRVIIVGTLLAATVIGLAAGLAENTASLAWIGAIVVGIIVLPSLAARPVWSVYLAFTSSMVYFSASVAGQVLSPVRVFGLITVGIWAMTLVSQPKSLTRLRSLVARNRIAQGMLLLVLAAVSTFLIGYLKFPAAVRSPQLKFSPIGYVQLLISSVLLYFSAIHFVNTERKVITLLKVMTWISVGGLLYASAVMLMGRSGVYFLDTLGGGPNVRVRITQWYQILMPFLVVWLVSGRTRILRKLALSLAIGVLLFGMILSATRSAFVSIAVQLCLYTMWYPRKLGTRRPRLWIAILVLSVLVLTILASLVPARFRELSLARLAWLPMVGSRFDVETSRIPRYLKTASIYVRDLNWLTGIGFGHFEAVFHYHYTDLRDVVGTIWTDAHCLLITLPLEMGILGIVVLWLFGSGIRIQLRRALHVGSASGNRDLYELAIGCTASLFALVPSLLFQGPALLDRNLYFIMAIISVLGLVSRSGCQRNGGSSRN